MTKLSKRQLTQKEFGQYINNLWSAFTLLDSKNDIRALFRDLFTHTEYKMFAKRLEIARRLLDGMTYEEIGDELKVTMHTISSVSNSLARNGDGYRRAHQELRRIEAKHRAGHSGKGRRPTLAGERALPEIVKATAKKISAVSRRRARTKSASHNLSV